MIKRMLILARRGGTSREAFSAHWHGVHAPMARKLPSLIGYVQNHVVAEVQRTHVAPGDWRVDGIAELWFPGEAEMQQSLRSDAGRALVEDESNFASGVSIFLVEERVVIDRMAAGAFPLKRISLLKRRDGLSPQGFSDYWASPHGELVKHLPHVGRYVQNRVTGASHRTAFADPPQVVDGFVEFRFADGEGMRAAYDSAPGRRLTDDAKNLISAVSTWIVEPRTIVGG